MRIGGRRIRVRLPGYGAASLATATLPGAASAARPLAATPAARAADAALARVFGAPLVAKSSRSRLVPSPVR
jgi:hypothetical protein